MKIFCDRLREVRGSASQAAFAKSLSLNQQTYQRYESGVREPDLETLHRIGVTYSVSVDWLLGLPPSSSSPTVTNSPGAIVGTNAGTITSSVNTSKDCENCRYKRLAEALKAVQAD